MRNRRYRRRVLLYTGSLPPALSKLTPDCHPRRTASQRAGKSQQLSRKTPSFSQIAWVFSIIEAAELLLNSLIFCCKAFDSLEDVLLSKEAKNSNLILMSIWVPAAQLPRKLSGPKPQSSPEYTAKPQFLAVAFQVHLKLLSPMKLHTTLTRPYYNVSRSFIQVGLQRLFSPSPSYQADQGSRYRSCLGIPGGKALAGDVQSLMVGTGP